MRAQYEVISAYLGKYFPQMPQTVTGLWMVRGLEHLIPFTPGGAVRGWGGWLVRGYVHGDIYRKGLWRKVSVCPGHNLSI